MGFIAAIPVGATQIEIAKRLLKGYTLSATMIVLGAISSDFIYGNIAMFGIAPFLQSPGIEASFSVVNSVILILLGILTLRQSRKKAGNSNISDKILSKYNVSYVTGFLLAVANPVIIYWWLLGSRFLGSLYYIERYNVSYTYLYLVSGTLGIASYPLTILIWIKKRKQFFSEKFVQKGTAVLGISLLGLAIYFIYHSAYLIALK